MRISDWSSDVCSSDLSVSAYDGDMDDYRKLLLEQRRLERSRQRADKPARDDALSKKDKRRAAAEARAAVADLRKAAREAEAELEQLNRKKAELEARLADPKVYDGPTAKLDRKSTRLNSSHSCAPRMPSSA